MITASFKCPNPPTNSANLYPDPKNNAYFYQCSSGVAKRMPCPPNLIFNVVSLTCAPAVGCAALAAGNPAGLYPDLLDCTHYYQCSNNIPYHMACPAGLYFNPTLYVCDYPNNAGCVLCQRKSDSKRNVERLYCRLLAPTELTMRW